MSIITEIPLERWQEIEIVGSKWHGAQKNPVFDPEKNALFVSKQEAAYYYGKSKTWVNKMMKRGEIFKPIDLALAQEIFSHNNKYGIL